MMNSLEVLITIFVNYNRNRTAFDIIKISMLQQCRNEYIQFCKLYVVLIFLFKIFLLEIDILIFIIDK